MDPQRPFLFESANGGQGHLFQAQNLLIGLNYPHGDKKVHRDIKGSPRYSSLTERGQDDSSCDRRPMNRVAWVASARYYLWDYRTVWNEDNTTWMDRCGGIWRVGWDLNFDRGAIALSALEQQFYGRVVGLIRSRSHDNVSSVWITTNTSKKQAVTSMPLFMLTQRLDAAARVETACAPWDMYRKQIFPLIGYSADFLRLDSKDFYLPQTRQRGYLIAVDAESLRADKAKERLSISGRRPWSFTNPQRPQL
ncbi:hypothetical protein QBC43DRAFT_359724 [Cladorrhinum sp. PSN259]|nr:hypothetical protein QBC43DRAFT_359724 [Cladorrhinum sp. PSN259]